MGAIDGDPLYNAQDTDIKHFVVHKPAFANGVAGGSQARDPQRRSADGVEERSLRGVAAEVKVSFENFGKKEEIVFLLTSDTRAGWKITNIKYNDGTDLLEILKGGD